MFILILISFQVNFMISGAVGPKRHRRRVANRQQPGIIPASSVQLYRDLAQASGGTAIEVDKTDISAATSIIIESSTSSQVLLWLPLPRRLYLFVYSLAGYLKKFLTGFNST